MASKSFWDKIQLGGDILGMVPLVGNFVDVANAAISAARGDAAGAGLRLAAAVPGFGQAVTGGKIAKKGADAVSAAKGADNLPPLRMSGEGIDQAQRATRSRRTTQGAGPREPEIRQMTDPTPRPQRPRRSRRTTEGAGPREPGIRELVGNQTQETLKRRGLLNRLTGGATARDIGRRGLITSPMRVPAAALTIARPEIPEGMTLEDYEKLTTAQLKAFDEARKKEEEALKKSKKDYKQSVQDRLDKPLLDDETRVGREVAKDTLADLRGDLEEAEEETASDKAERKKQIGQIIRDKMTSPGFANPDYWNKNRNELNELLREGKKLGVSSDDVKRVIKNSYKDAVAQKRQDVYEAETKDRERKYLGMLDNTERAAAKREKRDVRPDTVRRDIDRMKGAEEDTGYRQKDAPTPEAIQIRERGKDIEKDIKTVEKQIEDYDIQEGQKYYDFFEEGVKAEKDMKKKKKEDAKKANERLEKMLTEQEKKRKQLLEQASKPRSLATMAREGILSPIEKGIKGARDAVFGGGDFR